MADVGTNGVLSAASLAVTAGLDPKEPFRADIKAEIEGGILEGGGRVGILAASGGKGFFGKIIDFLINTKVAVDRAGSALVQRVTDFITNTKFAIALGITDLLSAGGRAAERLPWGIIFLVAAGLLGTFLLSRVLRININVAKTLRG